MRMQDTDYVISLRKGLLCTAPRGRGYAGELHPQLRRERGAIVALRTSGKADEGTWARVHFRDGLGFWVPFEQVAYALHGSWFSPSVT